MQLAIAKETVLRFDCAQDTRILAPHELALRRKAKLCSFGLASLQLTICRQQSRVTYLAEGDANTKKNSICKHAIVAAKVTSVK